MAAKTVLDLAQALPESERKDLFERIQRSLSLNVKQEQNIVKSVSSSEHRTAVIQEALAHVSIIQKVMIWFKKLFTAKSEADIYVDMKMQEISRIISGEEVADPVGRSLRPKLANEVYRLYLAVVPIKKFLEVVWSNEAAVSAAMQYVIEEKIPKARSNLYDFIPADEIQVLFEHSENKGAIRQELVNRLNSYIESIPESIFRELEAGVMPLYYLRQLAFFDYNAFFRSFYADQHSLERGNPNFKVVSVDKVLASLEELHYALHTARKASSLEIMPPQLYKYVQLKRQEHNIAAANQEKDQQFTASDTLIPPAEAQAQAPAPVAEVGFEEGLRQLRKDLHYLQEAVAQAVDRCKISDVIRYFRADPYYRFMAYVPSINLKEFYIATLRMQLLSSLDKDYPGIRRLIVANIIKSMFPQGPLEFSFFKTHPFGQARSGIPGFRYVTSLQYLYSFLQIIFFTKLRETCRIIAKALPTRNRDTGSELIFHTAGLETVFEMIKSLDQSFSPDSEAGKNYIRLKNAVQKDLGQERPYRAYTAQRDKENRDLLEEAIEHIKALANASDEVANIPAPLLTERFSVLVGQSQGNHATPGDIIRGIGSRLRGADRLLRYQRALDDEAPLSE